MFLLHIGRKESFYILVIYLKIGIKIPNSKEFVMSMMYRDFLTGANYSCVNCLESQIIETQLFVSQFIVSQTRASFL